MTRRAQVMAGAAALAAAAAAGAAWGQAAPTGPNPASVQAAPGRAFVKTKMALFAYAAPNEQSAVIDEVVGQTVLPVTGCAGGWCRVVMARAAPSYIRQELLEPVAPQR